MRVRVAFKIQTEGKPPKPLEVAAYLFSQNGTFLASAPVKGDAVEFSIDEENAREARVFFAPPIPDGKAKRKPTLRLMERVRAYEAPWSFDPKTEEYALLPIPQYNWKLWPFCFCRIRGQVVKPVTVDSTSVDFPVCHARVHICEVDWFPILIERLPDPIIFRIRDELNRIIAQTVPTPPGPGPLERRFMFDPSVLSATPEALAKMQLSVSEAVRSRTTNTPLMAEKSAAPRSVNFPDTMLASLQSDSPQVIRQSLVANVNLVIPWFCIWEWFWPWWTCEEIAVIDTDDQGNFDTTAYYICGLEDMDLYFWVEYSIGGVWTTVYDPPLLCNTYWNYVCGSEVTIRIYDPRVTWCGGPITSPGLSITVLTIGDNVNVNQVDQNGGDALYALTPDGRPFGGSLEPHVWFGSDALIAANITHYRWSYRKADGVDSWHAMDAQVIRHYAVPGPGSTITFLAYLLGPDPAPPFAGQSEFQIQTVAPPAGALSWAPQVDGRENTASAKFLSYLLDGGDALTAAGVYQLKLELFDINANLVDLTNAGVGVLVPPANLTGPFHTQSFTAVPAPDPYLLKDVNGHVLGFTMMINVDNNPCVAQIYPVSISGTLADPCGFLHYGPSSQLLISFKAEHPNSFGTFHFEIDLGSQGARPGTVDGRAGPNKVAGPYTSDVNGVFSGNELATDLLNGCEHGAFAETLIVWAMATDGWNILSYLDASATPVAFALTH